MSELALSMPVLILIARALSLRADSAQIRLDALTCLRSLALVSQALFALESGG